MCGIFGALTYLQFISLYKLNLQRGDYSTGITYFKDERWHIIKERGEIDVKKIPRDAQIYLGHVRAPTQGLSEFNIDENHPFRTSTYILAHNGIIHNDKELRSKYYITSPKTDSYIIAVLLEHFRCPTPVIEQLDGIFGCWVVNTHNNLIILFRVASSIFIDKISKQFSSVKFDGAQMLPEGVIISFPDFEKTGKFKYNSPYLVLE